MYTPSPRHEKLRGERRDIGRALSPTHDTDSLARVIRPLQELTVSLMADAGPEVLQLGLVEAHRAKLGHGKCPAGPQLARDGGHGRVLRVWELHRVRGEDHVDAASLDVVRFLELGDAEAEAALGTVREAAPGKLDVLRHNV